MPDLYGSVSLPVQGTLKITVLRHLELYYIVLPRPTPRSSSEVAQTRLADLGVLPDLGFWSRPFKLKSLILHIPLAPGSGFDQPVELTFGVDCFGEVGVNVGLLNIFES